MGDMLLGLPSSTSVDAIATPYTYNRFTSFDLYAMDDWKVTPDLTFNLGLRWELNLPVSEKYGRIATFVPSKGNDGTSDAFVTAAESGSKTLYTTDRHSFAPRIGFAWQPLHNDKTVVKGAFGTFYQEPILYNEFLSYSLVYPIRTPYSFTSAAVSSGTISGNPTVLTLNNPFNSGLLPQVMGEPYCIAGSSNCNGVSTTGCAAPCSLIPVISGTYIDPKYGNAYWDEWSVSIERQLSRTTLVEVGYYGSKGSQIAYNGTAVLNYNSYGVSTNEPTTTLPTGLGKGSTAVTQSYRVYPNWGSITEHKTGFNSEFESLPVRLEERTKSGASILVSYTFAKSLDDLTSAQNPDPNYVDPQTGKAGSQKGDRELSSFNVKSRLVISPVYPLPFGKGQMWLHDGGLASAIAGGWKVSGVFQYFTGRPVAESDTSVSSGSYGGGDRPDFTSNPNASVDPVTKVATHNAKEWFNVHAFDYNYGTAATSFINTSTATTGARIAGTFGNSSPNMIIGPGWDEIDMTIGRTFPVTEKANLEVKVDGFNIANHPNYMSPAAAFSGSYTSGGFGTITAANNMRELQGSIHLTF
jgi:hypothetical protein